jgi:hypothetical protein
MFTALPYANVLFVISDLYGVWLLYANRHAETRQHSYEAMSLVSAWRSWPSTKNEGALTTPTGYIDRISGAC